MLAVSIKIGHFEVGIRIKLSSNRVIIKSAKWSRAEILAISLSQ